jgi:hypothetical protein
MLDADLDILAAADRRIEIADEPALDHILQPGVLHGNASSAPS